MAYSSGTSADPLATGSDQPVERVPALFALGSYLRRGRASDDARRLFLTGGREADTFYPQ